MAAGNRDSHRPHHSAQRPVIPRPRKEYDDEESDVMSLTDRPEGQPERRGSRRLTRSTTDRKIAGVCGGFATYSGIDANIVRLVMVLLAALGGMGVALYLVAWVIVPTEDVKKATDHEGQLISSS
jgi:phage shock protein PspC (stress-responsive transcriptional regulator)